MQALLVFLSVLKVVVRHVVSLKQQREKKKKQETRRKKSIIVVSEALIGGRVSRIFFSSYFGVLDIKMCFIYFLFYFISAAVIR